jgi:acyl carrier protein
MAGNDVRGAVIDVVADTLAVDRATVSAAATLAALPTFNSFRAVEIVERLEERLGVELDAADLVPDNLNRIGSLCALFERAALRIRSSTNGAP